MTWIDRVLWWWIHAMMAVLMIGTTIYTIQTIGLLLGGACNAN